MRWLFAAVLLFGFGQNGLAEDDLELKVTFFEALTREPLTNSEVIITYNNQVKVFKTGRTDNSVELILPLDYVYDVRCVKKGYVFKHVEIDLTGIPEENNEGGFRLELDMTLFHLRPEFDISVMQKPIGKCAYDSDTDNIEFDLAYTIEYKTVLSTELKKTAEFYSEDYYKWKAKGDKSMSEINYKKALKYYRKALNYIDKDEELEEKYLEIKERLERYN